MKERRRIGGEKGMKECIGKKERIGRRGETKKEKEGVGKKYCIRVRGGKEIMRKIV
jgi:hypothetical protein